MCLQKTVMTPEDSLPLNCYRTLLIHQIQPRLAFICSLNLNHTFLVTSLETMCVVEECLGDQDAAEGIAVHEHRWTKCIDVMGDYLKQEGHDGPESLT